MESVPHPRPRPRYPFPITPEHIAAVFGDADDFCQRQLEIGNQTLWAFSIDGLVSGSDVSDYVFKPLTRAPQPLRGETAIHQVVYNAVAERVEDLDAVCKKLVNGFCVVLFAPGDAVAFEVKTGEKRSVSPPEVENTVKGAKDAFTETIRTNTSLIRRHLRTPELRLDAEIVGRQTMTNVTVAYVAGLTNPESVQAVTQRLKTIDVEGVLSPGVIEEYLTGSRKTAFPMQIYTERTDKFCTGLLGGQVGVLVDGLPLGYLLPCTLEDFLSSPEDRSGNYIVASGVKLLRYLCLIAALLLPGVYAAMAMYHQEMIPATLLIAIAESKENVPFSTGVEVLLLLVAFELLQEAGLQLPQNLGHAVSIIGGLVVGSAAVDASLLSPAALIVVSAAGICGFALPQRDFADAVRVWRMVMTLGGIFAGLAGVTLAFLWMLIHLGELSSLNIPYLYPLSQGTLPGLRPRMVTVKQRRPVLEPENRRKQR